MTAVVVGASGFIGTRLVARLAGRGEAVNAVDIVPPRLRLSGVRYLDHDVREPFPPGLIPPGATVFNLAAVHRTPGHPTHEYFETNVGGALNLVAAVEAAGVHTVVFTSSIAIYGPCDETRTEASPPRPNSDYGRSKLLAEEIHSRWAAAGPNRRLVMVRPGVVFGPGEGGNYTALARMLRRGTFAYPGRRTTIKGGGHVDELLRSLDFALARAEPEITYNFAYPAESTTEDIVRAFGRVMGRERRYAVAPTWSLLAVAAVFEALATLGLKTAVHRDRVWKLVYSTRIAPTWLLQQGYHFESDLETALAAWGVETEGRFT